MNHIEFPISSTKLFMWGGVLLSTAESCSARHKVGLPVASAHLELWNPSLVVQGCDLSSPRHALILKEKQALKRAIQQQQQWTCSASFPTQSMIQIFALRVGKTSAAEDLFSDLTARVNFLLALQDNYPWLLFWRGHCSACLVTLCN